MADHPTNQLNENEQNIVSLEYLRKRNLELAEDIARSKRTGGSGEGPHMPEMSDLERRLDTLESEHRTHFRWTIGTLIIVAFGLVTLITTLSLGIANFLSGRIERTEDRITRLDDRVGRIETAVSDLPTKINQNLMQLNQTLLQAVIAGATQRRPEPPSPPSPQNVPQKPPG